MEPQASVSLSCYLCQKATRSPCDWIFKLPLHCSCCTKWFRELSQSNRRLIEPPCVHYRRIKEPMVPGQLEEIT